MAYQDQSLIASGMPAGRPSYLGRTLLGTLALILTLAFFGSGAAYDPAERDMQSVNPQVPAQMQEWRGNSAHIENAQ